MMEIIMFKWNPVILKKKTLVPGFESAMCVSPNNIPHGAAGHVLNQSSKECFHGAQQGLVES